ncbi:MAG: hypothetical protein KBT48_10080 [Firmicutes bacterium]|nr:hypothetical protein [Bacillota bacterium]
MKPFISFIVPFFFLLNPSSQEIYLSQSKTIHIATDENIDFTQSEILLNHKKLEDLHEFVFTVDKEGKNVLEYTLVNEAGEIVEKGERIYILDTQNPEIKVSQGYVEFEDSIGLFEDSNVRVEIKDDTLSQEEIYVDDKRTELENGSIFLKTENKTLKIEVSDHAGHRVKKEFKIEVLEPVEMFSSVDSAYTLDPTYQIFSEQDLSDYELVVNGDAQDSFIYDFEKEQEYFILVRHKRYPDLIVFSQHLDYYNHPLELNLQADRYKSNSSIHVLCETQNEYLEEVKIFDSLGNNYDLGQSIEYKAKENSSQKIELTAMAKDLFGRVVSKKLDLQLSTLAPEMELSLNDRKMLEDKEYVFVDVDSLDIQSTAQRKEEFRVDGAVKQYVSLEAALRDLPKGKTLAYFVRLEDEFGNTSQKLYTFKKEYKAPLVSQETYNSTRDVIESRVWSVDEKGEVKLVENHEEKVWHPLIYMDPEELVSGKQADIIFFNMKEIKALRINGKEIDISSLKKDSMGNWKYTYTIPRQSKEIKVEVKDASNQWLKKTSSVKSANNTSIYYWIPCILLLLFFIVVKYV